MSAILNFLATITLEEALVIISMVEMTLVMAFTYFSIAQFCKRVDAWSYNIF